MENEKTHRLLFSPLYFYLNDTAVGVKIVETISLLFTHYDSISRLSWDRPTEIGKEIINQNKNTSHHNFRTWCNSGGRRMKNFKIQLISEKPVISVLCLCKLPRVKKPRSAKIEFAYWLNKTFFYIRSISTLPVCGYTNVGKSSQKNIYLVKKSWIFLFKIFRHFRINRE